ncbi:MAG TPA: tannase/feruloyl esterase family alpha/beta hydrolase [Draconibacterium sp.]|nr:tannase/feruloyl esterase family alpha/beta hydrolase [Draconibacterium sp.]
MKQLLLLLLIVTCLFSTSRISTGKTITKNDLNKVGTSIPASEIGEPVGSVKLYAPRWIEAEGSNPDYAVVEGSIFPADPNGWPINFRALLPSDWSRRTLQQGGGGFNGTITVRDGFHPLLSKGYVLYGSDSGHQVHGMGFPGAPQPKVLATGPTKGDEWALNEEVMQNLGYMQMKKTHDAVMAIVKRVYGEAPEYNYYVGNSQGGREAVTVAQRYPEDYDGIISNVPIVNFSTLMLAPVLLRIQEIPEVNWITSDKEALIAKEFLRQCDALDGLSDGIINNYVKARELFNVNDGKGPDDPWAALRKSGELTDGQIETLELTFSSYRFANPLANGVESFGMWIPNVTPGGSGIIDNRRYKGQEGAAEDAPLYTHMGILGVTGFLMQDIDANSLDYVEGGKWEKRRQQLSRWLDSTDPDLAAFYNRGGKIIFTIGAGDNLASSGSQLDYYQSLLDKMGRDKIDEFARMYVVPNGGHGLSGRSYSENGDGEKIDVKNIAAPDGNDNLEQLVNWVENDKAPAKTLAIGPRGEISERLEGEGYLMCSYPSYAKYTSGPKNMVSSYSSVKP